MAEVTGLNWLRGLTALAVMLGHARGFGFVDYPDLAQPGGVIEQVFYLLTGLGTGAVMIFFVLSGYLVAGSVDQAQRAGRFGWPAYLVARLSRLWTAILPALFVTLLCDWLAVQVFSSGFHLGRIGADIASAPEATIDLGLPTLLGNMAFLQTIVVPVYGSNGPLWSIANEFWYYIAFPCLFLATRSGEAKHRLVLALAGVSVLLAVGQAIALLFPVWLMGFAAYRFEQTRRALVFMHRRWLALTAVGTLVVVVLASRISGGQATLWGQYAIGLATALSLPALRHGCFARGAALAHALASFSFSLYLVHFPVQALYFSATGGLRADSLGGGMLCFLGAVALSLLTAIGLYWLTERHHLVLRRAVLARIVRSPIGRAS